MSYSNDRNVAGSSPVEEIDDSRSRGLLAPARDREPMVK